MADTIQDLHGGLMRKTFPNASEAALWGASITYHLDGSMTLRCEGEEVKIPMRVHPSEPQAGRE